MTSAGRLHEVAFCWLLLLALVGLPVSLTLALVGDGWLLFVAVIVCGWVTGVLCGVLSNLDDRQRGRS